MSAVRPRIGLTLGDPSGIGPEIAARVMRDPDLSAACELVPYGPDAEALTRFVPGQGSAEGGRVSYEAVRRATADALAGRLDAVTTAPINKEMWARAGLSWRGHTDLLAHLTGTEEVAMMFHAEKLRVVLATVHVPLRDVSDALTPARIDATLRLADEGLRRFGVARPRIGLAGVNPHAGEAGLLGEEEADRLAPAVARARARGLDVTGPLPGDTVFLRALAGAFDVVVACYHDQGLIPVKLVAFGEAVNVTLGLPIIRTSVDHGTAYDIAGRGTADPSSLAGAVRLAVRLATTTRTAVSGAHG